MRCETRKKLLSGNELNIFVIYNWVHFSQSHFFGARKNVRSAFWIQNVVFVKSCFLLMLMLHWIVEWVSLFCILLLSFEFPEKILVIAKIPIPGLTGLYRCLDELVSDQVSYVKNENSDLYNGETESQLFWYFGIFRKSSFLWVLWAFNH